MKCKRCGECCQNWAINHIVSEKIIKAQDGVCVHFKDGLCSIYSKRPKECKEWFCKRYI